MCEWFGSLFGYVPSFLLGVCVTFAYILWRDRDERD